MPKRLQKEGCLTVSDNVCYTVGSQKCVSIYLLNEWALRTMLIVGFQGLEYMGSNLETLYNISFFSGKTFPSNLMMPKDNWIISENEILSYCIQGHLDIVFLLVL